jgi:hypothetical protein
MWNQQPLDWTEADAIYENEETDEEQEEDSNNPYTDAAEATPEELCELFVSDDCDTELEGFRKVLNFSILNFSILLDLFCLSVICQSCTNDYFHC